MTPVELLRCCPAMSVTDDMAFASRGLQITPAPMQSRPTLSSKFATLRSPQHEAGRSTKAHGARALKPELLGAVMVCSGPAFARLGAARALRQSSSEGDVRLRRRKSAKLLVAPLQDNSSYHPLV